MPIALTHHAKERMIFRKVTLDMIEETIFTPDSSEPAHPGRRLAFKWFDGRLLKVVYKVEGGDHVIISVIWEETA
jgi:hypothetical protein